MLKVSSCIHGLFIFLVPTLGIALAREKTSRGVCVNSLVQPSGVNGKFFGGLPMTDGPHGILVCLQYCEVP
jgi:hypothetical protein